MVFNNIIVVCVGNICRSPIGEALLKKYMPDKNISSAGVAAVVGRPAHSFSVAVSNAHDLSLDDHRGRQLTGKMCNENELILVMEKSHIDRVCDISISSRGKIMLFGHWLNAVTIADPINQNKETFEITYELLDESAKKWKAMLS